MTDKTKKVKLIYNPSAGESSITYQLDQIIALYQSRGYLLIPYRLDFTGNPFDIIHDLDQGYHHLLIAGGDGSVNYVVNLLKRHNIDLPVGVLPSGTANDFATLLGMPSNILLCCRELLDGQIVPVDLGCVNGEFFVNIFSCGLLTNVSQRTPTVLKNAFGKLAYYAGGLGDISRFHRFKLNVEGDGGSYSGDCVIFFVFNGSTAGNFKIAHLSQIDDGLLDVVIVKTRNPLNTLSTLTHFLPFMKRSNSYPKGVVYMQCRSLSASSDSLESTDIDGQPGPSFPLKITCERHALRVVVPKPRP